MQDSIALKMVAVALIATLTVSGCATTKTGEGQQASESGADECNAWVSGAVGAVGGAVVGLLKGENPVIWAIGGGTVGALACLAINATSRQTKTAKQVESEYRAKHKGSLPAEPTLTKYTQVITPTAPVKGGGKVVIVSTFEVVRGGQQPIDEVKEKLELYNTDGKPIRTGEKTPNEHGGGSYENTFTIEMPPKMPQGVYPIRTTILINGKRMKVSEKKVQVVFMDGETRFALLTR